MQAVHHFSAVCICTSFGRISGLGVSRLRSRAGPTICPVQCVADAKTFQQSTSHNIARRSANYGPPIWGFDYIQSIITNENAVNFILISCIVTYIYIYIHI